MQKINRFADEFEIRYDIITDHDIYRHLWVSVEVARGQTESGTVLLNGREIGQIDVVRGGPKNKVVGFTAYRFLSPNDNSTKNLVRIELFKNMGHAAASIISDFVK
jgi:hypothetical protein